MGIKGLENVVANLNKEIKGIEDRSLEGLLSAVAMVRQSMEYTSPLIPISPGGGNLRASWFATPLHYATGPAVICGFGANYAVYVHEMLASRTGNAINWSRPGSGPKFFQSALRRNKDKILQIIRENAKVK
jgi:hypothetical protein